MSILKRAALVLTIAAIAAFVAWAPVVTADSGLETKARSLSRLAANTQDVFDNLSSASHSPYGRVDDLQFRRLERISLGTAIFGHSAGAILLLRTENGLVVERLTRDGTDNGRFTVYRHQELSPGDVPEGILTADESHAHARDFQARGAKPALYTTGGYDG